MVFTAFIEYTVSTSVFGVKCLLIFQKDNATTTPRIFVSYASSLIYPWNGCSVNVQYCINKGFPPTRMHDAFETRATLGEYSITLTSGALSLEKFNKSTHPVTAAAVSTLFAMMYRRAGALCYVAHPSPTPPSKAVMDRVGASSWSAEGNNLPLGVLVAMRIFTGSTAG